jgi:hypothetical protein
MCHVPRERLWLRGPSLLGEEVGHETTWHVARHTESWFPLQLLVVCHLSTLLL